LLTRFSSTKKSPPRGNLLSREAYIESLIAHGLDGIEAAYTYHKTTYKGDLSPEEIRKNRTGKNTKADWE
jgi:hypothetical protein